MKVSKFFSWFVIVSLTAIFLISCQNGINSTNQGLQEYTNLPTPTTGVPYYTCYDPYAYPAEDKCVQTNCDPSSPGCYSDRAACGDSCLVVIITPAPTDTQASTIPTELPPLNTRDIQSVIAWFLHGLRNQDISQFEDLISPVGVRYAHYYEGVQFVSPDEFIDQFNQRLSSAIKCEAITYYSSSNFWQIWTTNWTPQWEMTKLCYPDCLPMNPPFRSSNAGFFFSEFNGEWLLDVNYLRTMEEYFGLVPDDYTLLYECSDFMMDKLNDNSNSFFCPSSPTTRLEIAGFAHVSYDPPLANRVRSKPGTDNPIVGKIEPGGVMEILEGPKCVDNWVWWQVRELDTGLTGWTVEGAGNEYWLNPCDSAVQCGDQ